MFRKFITKRKLTDWRMLTSVIHSGDPQAALNNLEQQDPDYIGEADDHGAEGFEQLKNALSGSSVIVK